MRIVFIAEKPDIAAAMAGYIWDNPRKLQTHYIGGSSFGEETIITWAYGHILMQAMPEAYGEKFKDFSNYPVMPEVWKKIPSSSAKEQLKAIKMLIKTADIVVNGGDPDREGQLLVDEILEYCGYKGEVRRILINAKDNDSLKRAFASIQPNSNFRNLYMAGLARERADWLVGMNLSRAYSVNAQKSGLQNRTWRIGRVKIPTLSLVVAREREIQNFKPVKYYLLIGKFQKDGVPFEASLVIPEEAPADSEGRITSLEYINGVKAQVEGKVCCMTKCEKKSGIERAPLPYSLDTLQAETNKRFGVSPNTTLSIVQNLYEKKFVSYPRSDCNYIPDSQHAAAKRIIGSIFGGDSPLAKGADINIKGKAFDNSKVSAHHAIIPTGVKPSELSELERKIYDTIALRYLIQFYPPCRFDTVSYEIECNGYKFTGSGKVITDKGWKAVASSSEEREEKQSVLPPIEKGMSWNGTFVIDDKVTTPPKRFTEGSLLTAMTNIWRFVSQDNPNRERLKECKGLGTPATRATIISELMEQKGTVKPCLGKDGKDLYPTPFGCFLIDNIDESLTKPDFTAEMEYNLSQIADGQKSLEDYMSETEILVNKNIAFAEGGSFEGGQSLRENEQKPLLCPVCGKLSLVRKISKTTKKPFWVCSDQECKHPVTKETMFYDDSRNRPLIGLCPDCGTVMAHIFSKKTRKFYWRCPKCDAFKNDAKKFK